jgi:hypothetical protein
VARASRRGRRELAIATLIVTTVNLMVICLAGIPMNGSRGSSPP